MAASSSNSISSAFRTRSSVSWPRASPDSYSSTFLPTGFTRSHSSHEVSRLRGDGGSAPDRCVIELTEESLLDDYARLRSTLQRLREAGCEIAIDDLGAGSSGLRTWSELKPDFVKIDRYFVSGIDADPTKLEFVRSILDMGRAMGCRVIAEGVETERECRELVDLGLDRLQGHLFGRPGPAPMAVLQQVESLDRSIVTHSALCAEHIATYVPPVSPDMRVTEVVELFRDNPDALTIAVVRDGRPVGVVRRERLVLRCSPSRCIRRSTTRSRSAPSWSRRRC